jgi:hypothetical protein
MTVAKVARLSAFEAVSRVSRSKRNLKYISRELSTLAVGREPDIWLEGSLFATKIVATGFQPD